MLSKKKKIFILCGMLALLVVTGVLNIVLNGKSISASGNGSGNGGNNQNNASFFATYRTDRDATREQTILYLDSLITSSDDSQAIENARQAKLELTKSMETELVLEGLIKALGFDDVVVATSTESVNVIVKANELGEEDVTKITEIVSTETGRKNFDIRIISVE